MGILTRFKDIMSANINALLDKAEDPEKMVEQCLRNLNTDLGKVKAETATIMAEEQRAKRALNECEEEIEKMQNYAKKALEALNEADARKFLERKASLSQKRDSLKQAYDLAALNSAHMQEMHNKLVNDITQLESRREMIRGKLAVARTQEKINQMGASVNDANRSISAFERMEAKADLALDRANAMSKLNDSSKDNIKDLEKKYGGSALNDSIEEELASLKASLTKQA